jgi:TonB-linked SusC/RagA family outer membrane protein
MKKNLLLTFLLFALAVVQGWSQTTVTGTVTSEDGEALFGANILEKGTSNGTVTDFNGAYSIRVSDAGATLVFSSTGFDGQEVAIGGRSEINVTMKSGVQLNEVVVTALGISREKKALGYSITEVNGDEISEAKESNVINGLSGRVAGLVITQSSAGPGSGSRVIIRGNNSLGGNNQPLYVVDGVPVDNSGYGSAAGAGTANYSRTDYGTGISDLNSDDIESISVLKGPNAAALYGSRAANGVILITTKKGTSRKGLGVSYSAHFDASSPLLLPEFQNEYGQGTMGGVPSDLVDLKNAGGSWGSKMDGSSQLYWTGENRPYTAQPDNVKDFFRTGTNLVNTLALEGGNEKSTFRFSYSNTDTKSILENSGLQRHNFNLRASSQLSDRLSVDSKITYFQQQTQNRAVQGTEGIMANLYNTPRNVAITDLENYQDPKTFAAVGPTSLGDNPFWVLRHNKNDDSRNRIQGFVKATFDITDHLSIFGRIGTDYVNQNIESISQFGHWYTQKGSFNFRDYKTSETNADLLLMYNDQLSDDIGLSLNVGANRMLATSTSQGVSGDDFKIPTKPTVASARNTFPFYNQLSKKRIHSIYGSASFSYKNFAYLDLTARNDWSSTLPEDNWSYFYPSASLSLVFSELMESSFIDYGKVRFSWANVGSDTGPFQLLNTFGLEANSYLNQVVLGTQSVQRNPDLKPEQTSSLEFGLEFRVLQNRVYGDFSYYINETKDLITTIPVAAATGYTSKFTNVGLVSNKGVEFLVGFVPVKTPDFTWDVSLNFSKNKNQLLELSEGLDDFIFSTNNAGSVTVKATVEGSKVGDEVVENAGFGDIYGKTYETNDAGQIIVDDTGRPLITSNSVYLGNYQPEWTGGLSSSLNYKGLTFRFLIDARIGGQLYSGTDASLDASGVSANSLEYRESGIVFDGVVNTGTDEDPIWTQNTMSITGGEYWSNHSSVPSNYVFDQTNIRLREVGLSYTLPSSLFDNIFIESVNIGVVGRNLLFFKNDIGNFDPESSYSTSNFAQGMLYFNLPSVKSFGVNLNVKF